MNIGLHCPDMTCMAYLAYTGPMKVALIDIETHDRPIPLESTMRQGKVWAVICGPGKVVFYLSIGVIMDRLTPATKTC